MKHFNIKTFRSWHHWLADSQQLAGGLFVLAGIVDALKTLFQRLGYVTDRSFQPYLYVPSLVVDLSIIVMGLAFITHVPKKGDLLARLIIFDIWFFYAWITLTP